MKLKGVVIGAIGFVIALTAAICVMVSSGVFNPYEHQLSLAQKFLEEGNYEEAIIAFNKAIEIDGKKLDTYFALAKVYFENLDDLDSVRETLQRAYENTSEDSVAEKYIEFADRLIEKGRNTDAMELLSSGFDLTGNEEIKSKVGNMLDNLQLDDVTDTMSEELKEDFKVFIKAAAESPRHGEAEIGDFDKDSPNLRALIFRFVGENGSSEYLADKGRPCTSDIDYTDEFNTKMRLSESEMDWVLRNYYNTEPNHDLKANYINGDLGLDCVEYRDGYYYVPLSSYGFPDELEEILIDQANQIDETKYYIEFRNHWISEYDEESEEFYEKYYGVFERKNVDGLEFWSFIKTSDAPISLRELWEREN